MNCRQCGALMKFSYVGKGAENVTAFFECHKGGSLHDRYIATAASEEVACARAFKEALNARKSTEDPDRLPE